MSKLTKVPLEYIIGCVFLAILAIVVTVTGFNDPQGDYYQKLHPVKWHDVLGLGLFYAGIAYQIYYWITTSPEKNKSKLSDDSIVLNYLGIAVAGLGFIISCF